MADYKTVSGKLKHGLKIGAETHYDFELRELTTQDLFDAEDQASADKGLTFNAALLTRQLVRVGTFSGPFTLAMIGKLKPADYARLRKAQAELDALGEA
ncbi:MAG: phage tail assembly protein [Sinobacteraceae bacterium]|nr:phage tail assembly protein [Nevskiaceae bacterium]